ncbi:MAG: CPBP family glutamic-type intramembrane protease [Desulfomicrobium sp.]|nr:CPBP family glutamic-type intramembrane protease [Desulfomicrobium sp.]MDP3431024.1 CPBP family glutamic-type intramembrane protease [Desulfomicrobium sp.]
MLTNRQLLLPYIVPYMAYVAIASIPVHILAREVNYGLRLIVVTALLLWARRWLCSLTGPGSPLASVCCGVVAGVAGAGLWVVLLTPFVPAEAPASWSGLSFALRLLAAGLLVPVFEELMMRGYVFRLALQWGRERGKGTELAFQTALDERSLEEVKPGEWSWAAVIISTLVFTAGHGIPEWPASIAYGLLMCALWAWRRDLLSCIVAHSTTNIALAVYVWTSGNWQYW